MKEYWNDIEKEKTKPFWIENVEDQKLKNYLFGETNLVSCFKDGLDFVRKISSKKIGGKILDIGAGVGWTSAIVSQFPEVQSVLLVDYSKIRVEKIAPIVFEQFEAKKEKIATRIGDFFELGLEKEKFDLIIFCQALYMFPKLEDVLAKVFRLINPNGVVMIACERLTERSKDSIRERVRNLKFHLRSLLFGRSDASGNLNYYDHEYRRALINVGFEYFFQPLSYPVFPRISSIMAGNHFGLKADK